MNRKYITKKSEKQSLAFVAKLRSVTDEQGLVYLASVRLYAQIWQIAEACGIARQLIAESRNLVGAKYDRKDKSNPGSAAATKARNIRVHTIGVIGELLLANLLPNGSFITPLVAHKPDDNADAVVNDLIIDSKTTDVGATKIYINGNAHLKKTPTHYFVVHLVRDDIADIYLTTAKAVESWEFQAWRAAPCYAALAPAIDPASLPEKEPEFTA